jgi:YcxB-like protein
VAFTLTYTYSYDDFAALIRAKRSLGPTGRFGPVTPYIAVSAIYLVLVVASFLWDSVPVTELLEGTTLLIILAGVPFVMFLVWLIDFVFLHVVYRIVFRRYAIAGKEITITLDSAGVKWTADGLTGQSLWSNVKRYVETEGYLYLFFSKIEALPLPRRAVKSDQEFKALAAFVREHVNG